MTLRWRPGYDDGGGYVPGKLVLANDYIPVDPDFANVSLLLHGDGTNGSTTIIDSSPSPKTVTAVGDAKISTAQSKFGGASLAFDGNGDYLTSTINSDYEFGTGDFTVELFFNITSFSGISADVNLASIGAGANGGSAPNLVTSGWNLRVTSSSLIFYRFDGTTETSISRSESISTGTWHHVAVARSGTSLRIFFNGTQLGATATNSTSYNRVTSGPSPDLFVGRFFSGDLSGQAVPGVSYRAFFLNGYIDDLRITKGVARYTTNFTPPTAPFPDIASR